jgi:hypothetical protein
MMRKTLIIGTALATGVLAFTATSLAVGQDPEPRLRANLPAAALPAIALGESDAIKINNLLGELGSRAGITRGSYTQVRVLANTAAGPLYLIPGADGACLALGEGAGCGDPGAANTPLNAVATLDPSSERIVGGGVTDASVDRVEVVVMGYGVRAVVPVVHGAFSIDLAVPGFRPGKGVKFIAH